MPVGTRKTATIDAPVPETTATRSKKPSTSRTKPKSKPRTRAEIKKEPSASPQVTTPISEFTVSSSRETSSNNSPAQVSGPPQLGDQLPRALKQSLAQIIGQQDKNQNRVHKSHKSHRRHRRYRSSSSSSIDSENDHEMKVSFLPARDRKPFYALACLFPSVDIKYPKQIFFGTFKVKSLVKLAATHTDRMEDDDITESPNMMHLLRSFEVYAQAVCFYAAPSVHPELVRNIGTYRFRLCEMHSLYTFTSILRYHEGFITARVQQGQDDARAWALSDERCERLLVRRTTQIGGFLASYGK